MLPVPAQRLPLTPKRKNNIVRQRARLGFSLLELTIVMLVAGAVIAAIWVAAGQIMHENKKTGLNRDVVQIIVNTRALFSQQAAPIGSFATSDGITAGIFPPGWVTGPVARPILRQPFATDTSLDSASIVIAAAPASPTHLSLTIGIAGSESLGLPPDTCINLVTKLAVPQNYDHMGFDRIEISNGTATRVIRLANLPMPVAQFATSCATDTGSAVRVIFDPT